MGILLQEKSGSLDMGISILFATKPLAKFVHAK
jgi:hypothetical protein